MEKKEEVEDKFSKVGRIENGTVVDHVEEGHALTVLRILKIEAGTNKKISIGMNVDSTRKGKKDIIKVEDRELDPIEVDKIAVIAPQATINIIKDGKVSKKDRVKLPSIIEGIIRCQNPSCITNDTRPDNPTVPKEPVETKFYTRKRENSEPSFQCHYCGDMLSQLEAIKALI